MNKGEFKEKMIGYTALIIIIVVAGFVLSGFSAIAGKVAKLNKSVSMVVGSDGTFKFTEARNLLGPYFYPNHLSIQGEYVVLTKNGVFGNSLRKVPAKEIVRCEISKGIIRNKLVFRIDGGIFGRKLPFVFSDDDLIPVFSEYCESNGKEIILE